MNFRTIILGFIMLSFFVRLYSQKEILPALEILQEYPNVRDFTMSKSGNEAYISIQSPLEELSCIARITKKAGVWQMPEMTTFSGVFHDLEPFLTDDELRLFFVSNRPLNVNSIETKDYDIWYVERTSPTAEWSKPMNLGSPINTPNNEFYPSLAANGNLYFTSDSPVSLGKDDIFMSAYVDGNYTEVMALSDSINSEGYEYNAYISKDESYLLFGAYNREDGFGSGDIYISYKLPDNGWSKAKNLGPNLNSKSMDYCPFVDESKGVLYFTSKRSSLVKSMPILSIDQLKDKVNQYENGQSRIYQTTFDWKSFID